MSAEALPAPAAPALYRRIEVQQLIPTPENPRRFHEDDKFRELVASVSIHGVLQPILVRPLKGKKFEIRAGERRWRAARASGQADVPCIVREMSDREALEVTIIENMQRADLTPIEEAYGVASMLTRGWTLEEAANQLGKSRAWVARRASINGLTEAWKDALTNPANPLSAWSASHMEIIARLPETVQSTLLVRYSEERSRNMTASTLGRDTQIFLRSLSAAPWDRTDPELLPRAGACTACPKRSSCKPDLFAGVLFEDIGDYRDADDGIIDDELEEEEPEALKADDRCLDKSCWDAKRAAWLMTKEREAKEQSGAEPMLILDSYSSDDERLVKNAMPGRAVEHSWNVREVPAEAAGARPAIRIGGSRDGEVVYVMPRSQSSAAASGPKSLAEKRKQLKKLRGRLVCDYLKAELMQLKEVGECAGTRDLTHAEIVSLVASFGTDFKHDLSFNDRRGKEPWGQFAELCAKANPEIDHALLLGAAAAVISNRLSYVDEPPVAEIPWVCALLGIDEQSLWDRAAEEKPEPKSWAAQAAAEKAERRATRKAAGESESEGDE